MPPKKKGAAVASPAAKKRLTKRTAPKEPQAAVEVAEEAVAACAWSPGRDELQDNSGSVATAAVVVKEEGSGDAQLEQTTPEGAAATVDREGAVVDAASNGEIKVEEPDAAAGLPEKGQEDATHVAAAGPEVAGVAAVESCGGASAEDAAPQGSDLAGVSQEEEEMTTPGLSAKGEAAKGVAQKKMEVDDEPAAGAPPSDNASADADASPPRASVVAKLPASLLLQMGPPPSFSISHRVDDLRGLSTALSNFIRCWDSLSHHLGSIQGSMETLSRALDARHPQGKQQPEKMGKEGDDKKEGGAGVGEEAHMGRVELAKKLDLPQKGSPLDLESICEKMLGRNLRRYVVAHMLEVDRLREEVPRALRLAPNPAKLVLSCIGRFYLQGSRAYADPNSPMVSVRRACILVLEFFLLSGCPFSSNGHSPSSLSNASVAAHTEVAKGKEEPPTSVSEEANVAAIAWKNRLVAEGGVASASAVDALGLALFVASFGIPSDFNSETMCDVFRLCNMKKKADILRQSPIIVEKLPDIIHDLVQKEKYIAAADLACGFGLQEKYPPLDLISAFLIKTNTVAKEERKDGQCSVKSLKEATANQLAAYKSVVKCLEDHKLDPSSLSSFKIEEKISKFEKEIEKFEKKLKDKNLKRKAEDVNLTNEVKGSAKRTAAVQVEATSGSHPSWARHTQDHGRALLLSKMLYSGPSNRFSGLLDGNRVGDLAGNVLGPAGTGDRLAATASLFAGSEYSVGTNIRASVENSGVSYRWYQEGALGDSFIGHSCDSSIRSSYVGMRRSGEGLMGQLPTENLLQLPGSPRGMGGRAAGSGLYEFADNVLENQLLYGRSVQSSALSRSASGCR